MIEGNSSLWLEKLQDGQQQILEVIAEVWPRCCKGINASTPENKITDRLALELIRDPRSRTKWIIIAQHKLLSSSFVGDVVTKGYIDFVVFFEINQDVYLAYECKRLNVAFPSGFKSLADKYVSEGVMRYVSAQYAEGLPLGVMIGYVIDGDVTSACAAVKTQITKVASKLHCYETPPTQDLPAISGITQFCTRHDRKGAVIKIDHVILPVASSHSS